jgi:hypothetical protein
MRRRRNTTIGDLRTAIDCLPRDTRVAMLRGISTNPIIVGAYTDGNGICPMLAAHRNGGRTSFISFAKAWDGFAFRGAKVRYARRATERELLVLRTHLEASLLEEEAATADLAGALAEHRELIERRQRERREQREQRAERERHEALERRLERRRRASERIRPGDPDRSRELRRRSGWRWMRVVRNLDDYERVLEALEHERDAVLEREALFGTAPSTSRELDGARR